MLDTGVAIALRESDADILSRVAALGGDLMISAVTRVELEKGVYRDPALAAHRRALLDMMLQSMLVAPFDNQCATIFGEIAAKLGWSRSKTIDRMIAACAIANDAALVTLNGRDFRGIADLQLVEW